MKEMFENNMHCKVVNLRKCNYSNLRLNAFIPWSNRKDWEFFMP